MDGCKHIIKFWRLQINFTHIALIPKVKSLESVSQFRPISLCTMIYKIVSKVLTNWLKLIHPQIIYDTQIAFVSRRHITDNILVSCLLWSATLFLKTKRKGKTSHMAIKLDMSKAYGRVEWDYLKAVMEKLGFAPKWVFMIMSCVTLVSYSVY